jgi:poly(A) polymerase
MEPTIRFWINKIPYLRVIRRLARDENVTIWLVGGFLRDLYAGRPFERFDYDFTLDRKTTSFARRFARETGGTCVVLDKVQRSIRVVVKSRKGMLNYDFNDLRGTSIKEDLEKRDFTVNALAVDLLDRRGVVHDPTSGLKDVDEKTLRTTTPQNFRDDPVRILRAFSFMGRFGFCLESATARYVEQGALSLRAAAGERVAEELFKVFAASHAYSLLSDMDRLGVLEILLPESRAMRGMEQGDYHHLDVWGHSMETVHCFEDLYLGSLRHHPDIERYLREEVAQKRTRYQLMKLACLLHDVGKPPAHAHKDRRTIFYEHERIGSEMMVEIAQRLRLSQRETEFLSLLVFMHLRPGYLADTRMPSDKAVYRFFRASRGEGAGIIILSLSDWRATRGTAIDLVKRRSHERIMLSLIDRYFDKIKEKPKKRLISGHDIMRALRLPPSKLIGVILEEVEERHHLGLIHTKHEALDVAREVVRRKPQDRGDGSEDR